MADDLGLLGVYRKMLTIRRFEEKAAEMYRQGKIAAFGPSYSGEEAVAVGAIGALGEEDYVVSTYRQHGHCIAKGAEPRNVMAELFGKETGISRGRGGSTASVRTGATFHRGPRRSSDRGRPRSFDQLQR